MTIRTWLFAPILLLGSFHSDMATAQGDDIQSHQEQVGAGQGATKMIMQTSNAATVYTSPTFVPVTAATLGVPDATQGIIVATFTAESICTGGSWCSVRIVCDGVELLPASGTDFAFNSPNDLWKSLSVMRHSVRLGPGKYFCEVETAQVGGSSHRLDDWAFKLELWRTN